MKKKLKTSPANLKASKKWRAKNKVKCAAYYKEWRLKNKDAKKNMRLKHRYGITLQYYNKMLLLQDGKCKICFKTQEETGKALHVDHCHITLKVRGLLCYKCNRGLGHFLDNDKLLQRAAMYIKENNGTKNFTLSK